MNVRMNTDDLEQRLTERDIAILEDLEQFRLLTTRHLQRLHFPAIPLGSHLTESAATRGTTRVLTRLEGHGVITRLVRRIGGIKHGSALTIWQLGAAGDRLLRARRGDPIRRRYDEPGLTFASHTLAVADIGVAMRERSTAGQFELLELATEPGCWRAFSGTGTSVLTLKPDLYAVTADSTTETYSFIEVDRATEHMPAVIRKCHIYQRYERSGTEQQRTGLFPAVVWITPTRVRADQIRAAIAADETLDAALFWVVTSEAMLSYLAPYAPTTT